MTVAGKGCLGILIMLGIFAIPIVGYGAVTGGHAPSALTYVAAAVAGLFGLGGIVYLAVDAAIRHNRHN